MPPVAHRARLLLAAIAVLALLTAPIALAGPADSSSGGAASASASLGGVKSQLKKLRRRLRRLESQVGELAVNPSPNSAQQSAINSLEQKTASFGDALKALEQEMNDAKAQLAALQPFAGHTPSEFVADTDTAGGGIISGPFSNLGIVNGSLIGADLAPNTITGSQVDPSTVQLRVSSSCTASQKITAIALSGSPICNTDLGQPNQVTESSSGIIDVANDTSVLLNYSSFTFVVLLTGGTAGQQVTLIAANSNVQANDGAGGGALQLSGNWTPDADDTLTLLNNGSKWVEVSRSAN